MITRQEPAPGRRTSTKSAKTQEVADKGVSNLRADLSHFSMWVYALPVERVAGMVPRTLSLETSLLDGREVAWLSVLSFGDAGPRGFREHRIDGFEQTVYRLHVLHNGRPAYYLLNMSLGSLSAVAARHLWSMPWHLGAMEFEVEYDGKSGTYNKYRLRTESVDESAMWEIVGVDEESGYSLSDLPASILTGSEHLFKRRDGSLGRAAIDYGKLQMARGRAGAVRSEMLEKMGILTAEELRCPVFVGVERHLQARLTLPTVETEAAASRVVVAGPAVRMTVAA